MHAIKLYMSLIKNCPQCGAACTHLVQLGSEVPFWTCEGCMEKVEQGLQKYRTLFELYLERGCSRQDANAIVILAILQDPVRTRLPHYPV